MTASSPRITLTLAALTLLVCSGCSTLNGAYAEQDELRFSLETELGELFTTLAASDQASELFVIYIDDAYSEREGKDFKINLCADDQVCLYAANRAVFDLFDQELARVPIVQQGENTFRFSLDRKLLPRRMQLFSPRALMLDYRASLSTERGEQTIPQPVSAHHDVFVPTQPMLLWP